MPGRTQPPVQGSAVRAIASDSPQIMLRQAMTSPMFASTPRKPRAPVISVALMSRPVMKSSFTASRVQPWSSARGRKPVRGKKLLAFSMSRVDEHVLPGHEHVVHDEDRVVLVEPAGQRVVERAAHHRGALLVGHAADQLHARRVGRHDEDHGEVLVLHRDQPVVRDERVVRQRRAGGDDLGAADEDAGVGLLGHAHVDVGRAARRAGRHVAVHRRMDDRVVDERHAAPGCAGTSAARCPDTARRTRRWRRAWPGTPPCSRASGPSQP